MKLVLAIIPPDLVNKLLDDIDEQHLHVLTISEAQGFRQETGIGFADLELMPRMRVEVVCEDHEVDSLVACLNATVHSEKSGQGRILVLALESVQVLKNGGGDRAGTQ